MTTTETETTTTTKVNFETTAENEDNAKDFEIIKNLIIDNNIETALDIGACIGSFTKFLAENVKRVYAFEPSPSNFKRLEQNTKKFSNVFLYNVAISDHDTEDSTLYLCPQDIGMNRLYDSKWCKEGDRITNIKTFSIDSLNLPEPNIDFVKIDVEGYEYYVLMGMKRLLTRKYPPIIMMEFHPPSIEESGSNPKDIYEFMLKDMYYKEPIDCETNQVFHSYEELDKVTRNKPAVNLLWLPFYKLY